MGRSLRIYGAEISGGNPLEKHSGNHRAGRSHHKTHKLRKLKKAHHKHLKHKKHGPSQSWTQALTSAGLM